MEYAGDPIEMGGSGQQIDFVTDDERRRVVCTFPTRLTKTV
jgi:hypothetical protein